jgi:hypothetical protein
MYTHTQYTHTHQHNAVLPKAMQQNGISTIEKEKERERENHACVMEFVVHAKHDRERATMD